MGAGRVEVHVVRDDRPRVARGSRTGGSRPRGPGGPGSMCGNPVSSRTVDSKWAKFRLPAYQLVADHHPRPLAVAHRRRSESVRRSMYTSSDWSWNRLYPAFRSAASRSSGGGGGSAQRPSPGTVRPGDGARGTGANGRGPGAPYIDLRRSASPSRTSADGSRSRCASLRAGSSRLPVGARAPSPSTGRRRPRSSGS